MMQQNVQTRKRGFVSCIHYFQCEARYSSLKRHLAEESDSEYEDSEDEDDATLVTKATKVVKHVLYFVTDSERFHPPRKRPK